MQSKALIATICHGVCVDFRWNDATCIILAAQMNSAILSGTKSFENGGLAQPVCVCVGEGQPKGYVLGYTNNMKSIGHKILYRVAKCGILEVYSLQQPESRLLRLNVRVCP